ncbi:MAG: hypothetical protein ACJAT2_002328 [Bacteriovoracaceae bacterium]|jgi:hypothetical protein
MINFKTCNEEELWKYVAVELKKKGIDTILVGGAVVAIYTDGLYQSGDLDFVLGSMFTKGLEEAMNSLGFVKKSRHYVHPECSHLFVEFPGSIPLGIGEDTSIEPEEIDEGGVIIKIYSPTDCVKDRLATYIHFKDRDGLDQAIMVTDKCDINFESVKNWCENEGRSEIFEEYIGLIKKKK